MVIKIMTEIFVKLCHAEWNKSLYDFVYINVQKDWKSGLKEPASGLLEGKPGLSDRILGLGEATFRLKEPASELLEGKPGLSDRKLGLGEATFRLKEPASGLLEKTPGL